jgi:4-hydroxybenzoate polyprenyltransferase
MLHAIVVSMRPRQWTKNAFLFAALVFDGKLLYLGDIFRTCLGFLLFCFISSAVYIINDLFDVESDRQHPVKKNRPIASGKIPMPVAIIAAIILLGIALGGGYFLACQFALTLLAYFLIMLAYSKWLKHVPILDVLILAAGFVLRVHAGTTLIVVERFSPWLYV